MTDTYRDRAGSRRQRHLLTPEQRQARDAEARRLHGLGGSLRSIARKLECGRGTVERAIANAPPADLIIRGERIGRRPHVTIDGRPFKCHDAPEVTEWSPTGIEWGHYGAGSKRLAFMILLTVADRKEARAYAPLFAEGCLARITTQSEPWALTTIQVRNWLKASRETRAVETTQVLPIEVEPAARYHQQR